MDSITIGALAAGAIGLGVWLIARGRERDQAITTLVEGAMPERKDPECTGERDAVNTDDLPAQLDPNWVIRRAEESHALFKSSPTLFEKWLVTLRDRYSTPREVEILRNAEEKLRARMSFLKTAIEADALSQTTRDQHTTQVLDIKTKRVNAERAFEIAEGTATLSVQNELLKAQLENEKLRKDLEEARAASAAAHRPLIETQATINQRQRDEQLLDAQLAANVAAQKAEKAKHDAVARGYRKPASKAEMPPVEAPPPPPLTDEQRLALKSRGTQLRAQAIADMEMARLRDLQDCKSKFGEGSEEYRKHERDWSSQLIRLRESTPESFLSLDEQDRLRA